jgi:hypothetical protein
VGTSRGEVVGTGSWLVDVSARLLVGAGSGSVVEVVLVPCLSTVDAVVESTVVEDIVDEEADSKILEDVTSDEIDSMVTFSAVPSPV